MLIKWIKIETNSPLEKGIRILEREVLLKLSINVYSPLNENLKLYNINNNVLIPIFSYGQEKEQTDSFLMQTFFTLQL